MNAPSLLVTSFTLLPRPVLLPLLRQISPSRSHVPFLHPFPSSLFLWYTFVPFPLFHPQLLPLPIIVRSFPSHNDPFPCLCISPCSSTTTSSYCRPSPDTSLRLRTEIHHPGFLRRQAPAQQVPTVLAPQNNILGPPYRHTTHSIKPTTAIA